MIWLLRISNTHREISVKELENLIYPNELTWINELLLQISGSPEFIQHLINKSASIKWVMKSPQVFGEFQDVIETLHTVDYLKQVPEKATNTFAARFTQLLNKNKSIRKSKVERTVGGKILETFPYLKVNLDDPDQVYKILVSDNILVCGWIYHYVDFDLIASRSPKESPFFGGGAMKPMMAQLMINLLPKSSHVILDPFCGHGGFLREISAKDKYAVGIEITWKIIRETKINNQFHKTSNIAIIAGDALHSPLRKNAIDAMVTDPPYAKQSTTIGRDREQLVDTWLESQENSTIIMSLPVDMKIKIPDHYKQEYEVKDYVHRSLTRVVRKLRYNI